MLPRLNRLSHHDFVVVQRQGKKIGLSLVWGRFRPNPRAASSRWLVLVSKKTIPKAHNRNRLKRVVRDEIKKQINLLPKIQGDGVIRIIKAVDKRREAELRAQTRELLHLLTKSRRSLR